MCPFSTRFQHVLPEVPIRGFASLVGHSGRAAAARHNKHLGPLRGEWPAGRAQIGRLQAEPKGTGLAPLCLGLVLRASVEIQLLPLFRRKQTDKRVLEMWSVI